MTRTLATLICALVVLTLGVTSVAGADETVTACGGYLNRIFASSSAYGMNTNDTCPAGSLSITTTGFSYKRGQGAIWQTSAPSGLTIVGASVPPGDLSSNYIGTYGGNFYWAGGKSNITTQPGASLGPFSSQYFGFLLVCTGATCGPGAQLYVDQISLDARETSGPWLSSPAGLWQSSGWIRGTWTLNYWGDSPSGLCGINASFASQSLPGSTSARDPSTWHECAAGPVSDYINTANYGQGPQTVRIGAWDAAGEVVNYTKTVYVDNQPPSVSLSGPTNASSTAGVQHVTATVTAGPSGIRGLWCSVDGSPDTVYRAGTAQVPVSGVGEHVIRCQAQNNAVDASGNWGTSAVSSFAMKIGVPTVSVVSFSNVADGLSCRRVSMRRLIPGHWVKVHSRRKLVLVWRRSRTKRVEVIHCHARTKVRRIFVWVSVHRHGRWIRIRRPRTIRVIGHTRFPDKTGRLVAHGRTAVVHGWLGTTDGTALGRQSIDVLTAPDNGSDRFHLAAKAKTAANGGWAARLPTGPSRLITARYPGGTLTEGSLAAPAHLMVPARVDLLRVTPRHVEWGGTVRLVGQLRGGYLPRGGALVRLRIGQGSAVTTYGVREHVKGAGRFTTSYTFGAGDPSTYRSFWFQIASLPMGDYPYTPANSRRVSVLVGG